MTAEVFLTRTGAFLPFDAVGNDEVESVLGMVGGKPSRARRLVLRNNGIVSRHYAIDRASGEVAMTNAQLAAHAIRSLGETGPVQCLAAGTSSPDQLMPGHGVMVHGELGWPRMEVVSLSGICVSAIAALKYAWMAVRSGEARHAVACASELASPYLLARHFTAEAEHRVDALEERPELAFEKDFLRWMLSDGAGAALLAREPAGDLSLRIDWVEITSAAHEFPPCMYAGAEKNEDGSLRGWLQFPTEEWAQRSVFAVKQDVRLLNDNVVRVTVAESLRPLIAKHELKAENIDWFLPHMSSKYFADAIAASLDSIGLPIPRERWFTNLSTRGNVGAASPYIMLDELFRSGRVRKGQHLLMFVPESGRFSSSFVHLTAV